VKNDTKLQVNIKGMMWYVGITNPAKQQKYENYPNARRTPTRYIRQDRRTLRAVLLLGGA